MLIGQLQSRARKLKRLAGWWVAGTLVGVEVFVFCCWAFSGMSLLPYVTSGLMMIYFLVCVAMGMTLLWDDTGEQATQLGDKRLIGTLLDMLDLAKLGMSVHAPLVRLLPTLQAEDAVLLNEAQRGRLNQVLTGHDEPLILASLKALRQVGDKQALTYVLRLAEGKGEGSKNGQVRAAAQQCLTLLQERVEQADASQTLLRPTRTANQPEQTLLRAAGYSEPTKAEQLLRASDPTSK